VLSSRVGSWKGLPGTNTLAYYEKAKPTAVGTNTLAYYEKAKPTAVKKFITFATGVSVIKLFSPSLMARPNNFVFVLGKPLQPGQIFPGMPRSLF
jgi:hypothetical protein